MFSKVYEGKGLVKVMLDLCILIYLFFSKVLNKGEFKNRIGLVLLVDCFLNLAVFSILIVEVKMEVQGLYITNN